MTDASNPMMTMTIISSMSVTPRARDSCRMFDLVRPEPSARAACSATNRQSTRETDDAAPALRRSTPIAARTLPRDAGVREVIDSIMPESDHLTISRAGAVERRLLALSLHEPAIHPHHVD